MKNYKYDGSFQGFLTVVFEIFLSKNFNVNISSDNNSLLFESIYVESNQEKSERIIQKIEISFSKTSLYHIIGTFISNLPYRENLILSYIIKSLKYGNKCDDRLDDPSILKVLKCSESSYKEAHRIKGLLRFKELADNSFYGAISPDNNVLPVIYRHFEQRFPLQNWIIHDIGRKTAVIYENGVSKFCSDVYVNSDILSNNINLFSSEEVLFQNLWKEYFKAIAIPDRKNLKLQMKFVPKKYWKYIIEMENNNE